MWQVLSLIFNVIVALPKIWDMIKTIQETMKKMEEKKKEEEHETARQDLQKAQTPSDIESASDKYFASH